MIVSYHSCVTMLLLKVALAITRVEADYTSMIMFMIMIMP